MSIVEVHQQEGNGTSSSNACVLPQLRGNATSPVTRRIRFSLVGQSQRATGRGENDFLPQELMLALRQNTLPSEYLGPPGSSNVNRMLRPLPPVNFSAAVFSLPIDRSFLPPLVLVASAG